MDDSLNVTFNVESTSNYNDKVLKTMGFDCIKRHGNIINSGRPPMLCWLCPKGTYGIGDTEQDVKVGCLPCPSGMYNWSKLSFTDRKLKKLTMGIKHHEKEGTITTTTVCIVIPFVAHLICKSWYRVVHGSAKSFILPPRPRFLLESLKPSKHILMSLVLAGR